MLLLRPLVGPWRSARRLLPPCNFITIHYAYFIVTCLIAAVIFWGSSTPANSVRFVDALFVVVSAMTLSGLSTINLSTINTFQQVLVFLLIMFGSAIFVSAFVVQVRKRAFEKKFQIIIEKERHKDGTRRRTFSLHRTSNHELRDVARASAASGFQDADAGELPGQSVIPPTSPEMPSNGTKSGALSVSAIADDGEDSIYPSHLTFSKNTRFRAGSASQQSSSRRHRHSFGMQSIDAASGLPEGAFDSNGPRPVSSIRHSEHTANGDKHDLRRYFNATEGWISRNSQFHGLTERERERLGGYEYRAVSLLAWLVPAYYILFQLLGCLGCAAWVAHNRPDTALENGLNPWWLGAFNAVSAFNNSGMSLLDANMTAFQTGYYLLITMSLLILAGNTCYPVFLRLIVWTMLKIAERFDGEAWNERAATLRFLLDHPRRCYTNLFPAQHTWWLLLMVITLNGIDWAAFEILNIGNPKIDGALPTNVRVIDGLFQAFAVRSGGFFVVTISDLRISLQVLYVVMMYISVYPVVVTMRNSNVYEERSLGIYADDAASLSNANDKDHPPTTTAAHSPSSMLSRARSIATDMVAPARAQESNTTFVRHQIRSQLAHDAWIIILALFLITIIEAPKFGDDPAVFSVFNFLFDIVSGYGCVGISVGVPWDAYSFCGSWQSLSKLILCAVMIKGRHRGLPVAIDKAILLPGEDEGGVEEEDARIRLARVGGVGSFVLGVIVKQVCLDYSHPEFKSVQVARQLLYSGASQRNSEDALLREVYSAMPSEILEWFQSEKTDNDIVTTVLSQFDRNSSPLWFAQLSAPARTYFMTRWLGVWRDCCDIQGTGLTELAALQVTTDSESVPITVAATAIFRVSQEWSYMNALTSALPVPIAIFSTQTSLLATAVFNEFSSGSAPAWFTDMPRDVQSYIVQDFLPNYLQEPMTLDILALAKPGSTATPVPAPTLAPVAEYTQIAHGMSSKDKVVVAGTVIPVVSIGAAIAFGFWLARRRKRKQRSRPASSAHPFDSEWATQRWSETTFTTNLPPPSDQDQGSPYSPPPFIVSPASDTAGPVRRRLSESDLRCAPKEMVEIELSKTQDEPLELEAASLSKLERGEPASPVLRSV
ncbi:hypothetical protein Q7P37_004763 [Cladosporium fusiforme]